MRVTLAIILSSIVLCLDVLQVLGPFGVVAGLMSLGISSGLALFASFIFSTFCGLLLVYAVTKVSKL